MTAGEAVEVRCWEDPWDTVPVIGAGTPDAVGAEGHEEGLEWGGGELSVECDSLGTPCQLLHDGREFHVLQPAVHWYERRNWWAVEDRVPRASVTSAVDEERWRVQATRPRDVVPRTFELARSQVTGEWRVLRVSFG